MLAYPKIETLFARDPVTRKVTGIIRRPEFNLVKSWLVTEKVDGTNIRVQVTETCNGCAAGYEPPRDGVCGDCGGTGRKRQVRFSGRSDAAQIPPFLLKRLHEMFPPERFDDVFNADEIVFFGEGYGARIQKGGGAYREGVSFRLFDVVVRADRQDWWLTWKDVEDVARKLNIDTVPVLGTDLMLGWAASLASGESRVAIEDRHIYRLLKDSDQPRRREGIVARTEPPLFDRKGNRMIWKLKGRDLAYINGEPPGGY